MKRHVPLGQPRVGLGHARQSVLPERFILFRDRRIERQILGGNNLISVDVVAEDVGLADDSGLHGDSVIFIDHSYFGRCPGSRAASASASELVSLLSWQLLATLFWLELLRGR